jgi:serine protease AprX
VPLLLIFLVFATGFAGSRDVFTPAQLERLAPALAEEVSFVKSHPAYDSPIPVIVKLEGGVFQEVRSETAVALRGIHGYAARLTGKQIEDLVGASGVEYVTLDAVIRPTMDVRGTFRKGWSGPGNPNLETSGVDRVQELGFHGDDSVVALFDSGIGHHPDIDRRRVLAAVDFTEGSTRVGKFNRDGHGHGTAMAGIIGGSGRASGGLYKGVAPGVQFVDLKVIGDDGSGRTSDLIRAIDWAVEQKDRYGIRLANLSLGHPSFESYRDDPLCQAVGQMIEAGVVTVASAGNLGKTEEYAEIWGGITSPGTHPAVLTVSALNTNSTATHEDDVAASYASRGPALADGIFKPDLTAPGDAIPVVAARSSWLGRELQERRLRDYPQYLYLGGSSVAAAYSTGIAALMLDANPDLTVNLTRYVLLLTAIKLKQPHLLEQGNGLVNAKTAVDVVAALDVQTRSFGSSPLPYWDLDGEEVWAGGAFAFADKVYFGPQVDAGSAEFWGSGVEWPEQVLVTDQVIWIDQAFWPDQVIWIDQVYWTDQVIWIDQALWTDQVIWVDQAAWTDQVIWIDQAIWTDQVIWVDQVLSGDQVIWIDQAYSPDQVIWIDSPFGTDQVIWIDQQLSADQVIWID